MTGLGCWSFLCGYSSIAIVPAGAGWKAGRSFSVRRVVAAAPVAPGSAASRMASVRSSASFSGSVLGNAAIVPMFARW